MVFLPFHLRAGARARNSDSNWLKRAGSIWERAWAERDMISPSLTEPPSSPRRPMLSLLLLLNSSGKLALKLTMLYSFDTFIMPILGKMGSSCS